jgi:hypothetical protein
VTQWPCFSCSPALAPTLPPSPCPPLRVLQCTVMAVGIWCAATRVHCGCRPSAWRAPFVGKWTSRACTAKAQAPTSRGWGGTLGRGWDGMGGLNAASAQLAVEWSRQDSETRNRLSNDHPWQRRGPHLSFTPSLVLCSITHGAALSRADNRFRSCWRLPLQSESPGRRLRLRRFAELELPLP